jgi:hypothetical protein
MSSSAPKVGRKSQHRPAQPGRTDHWAIFPLDPMRMLDLGQFTAAARALAEAGVPQHADINIAYGREIRASWSVEDG